jgi:hypothetical protein
LINGFKMQKSFLDSAIDELIDVHPIPFDEDMFTANPIMQLHNLNKQFLLQTGNNLVQSPTAIMPRFYAKNPETGADESQIEWDFTSESYADGVWRPQDLFDNSKRNRAVGYWNNLPDTPINSDSDVEGLGHKYYNRDYTKNNSNSGPYAASQRTRSQFPRWQSVGSNFQYERDINEDLDEGGASDRRAQRPHGYNMTNLIVKSTY